MLAGKLANPVKLNLNKLNSDKYTTDYCTPIINILNNREKSLQLFNEAIDIFRATKIDLSDKQGLKAASVTEKVLAVFEKKYRNHQ